MTAPQNSPFQVKTPTQAEALLNFTYGARLLEKFIEPSSSSQAARALAEPANRVAYHVRKLADTGLLRVVERQGKRVLYQVIAQTFHVPHAFVRLDEPIALIEPVMREITTAYAHAILEWQARCDRPYSPDHGSYLTVQLDISEQTKQNETPEKRPEGPYSPAMHIRTLRVTADQYQQAQAALQRILTDFATQEATSNVKESTFVVMSSQAAYT